MYRRNYERRRVFYNLRQQYESDKYDAYNRALFRCQTSEFNAFPILRGIAYKDFPYREPRLGKNEGLSSKDIYLINIDKKIIFHMYDDRGLDLLAACKGDLSGIKLPKARITTFPF